MSAGSDHAAMAREEAAKLLAEYPGQPVETLLAMAFLRGVIHGIKDTSAAHQAIFAVERARHG